jgi:hypothetical protein
MPAFIATYDLQDAFPQPHGHFLNTAERYGWSRSRDAEDEFERIRETTLVGDFSDVDEATSALLKAADDLASLGAVKIKLTRWMVAQRTAARFHSDDEGSRHQ